jgi:transposase
LNAGVPPTQVAEWAGQLATSITGLSALGAAAILAETGDVTRFATARALVKHAGLAPREKLSGTFVGRTKLTGQGRPGLRLAAWRAVGERNAPTRSMTPATRI